MSTILLFFVATLVTFHLAFLPSLPLILSLLVILAVFLNPSLPFQLPRTLSALLSTTSTRRDLPCQSQPHLATSSTRRDLPCKVPVIPVLINNTSTSALVDTGSSQSICSTRLLSRLGTSPTLTPVHSAHLVSVDGSPVSILGTVSLPVLLPSVEHPISQTVVVADIHPDLILGVDFLTSHRCTIDFQSSTCLVDQTPISFAAAPVTSTALPPHAEAPLPSPSPAPSCSLPSLITVPAESQYVCPAVVTCPPTDPGTSLVLFEPAPSLFADHNIIGVATVASVSADTVPIRLINPTDHPITLPANSSLGSLSSCTVDDQPFAMCTDACPLSAATTTSAQFDTSHLLPEESAQLTALLVEFSDIVSTSPSDVGRTAIIQHDIATGQASPIRQAPRRIPIHQQEEVRNHIKKLVDDGLVEPSDSPWAAPIVVVRKPDGSIRLCVDYRKLNQITTRDAFPLPRVDDAIDAMHGCKYFTTLDLASGYWQVELEDSSKAKSAFVTPFGLFQWNVMPFGLCNAPGTFQRLMFSVLQGLIPLLCLVYLDDIIVFSATFQDHLSNLRQVLTRLRKAGLKIKPSKCHLAQPSVKYLGFQFSRSGVSPDADKLDAIRNWKQPDSKTEVRSFLGFASYYRRFIPDFSAIARPLHTLTESKTKFAWLPAAQDAFVALKNALLTKPVLAYPIPTQPFILDTDASDHAIGAVLSQVDADGRERVVAYGSKSLSHAQRRYSTTRRELLAVVFFCEYYRHYLAGARFTLRTDHKALTWLHNFSGTDGLLARWLERLAAFDYKIVHRPGKSHGNADGLSRSTSPNSINDHPVVNTTTTSAPPPAAPPSTTPSDAIPPSDLDIRTAQNADPDIPTIVNWIQSQNTPNRSSPQLQGVSQFRLALHQQLPRLIVQDGLLYRRYESDSGDEHHLQLVVPPSIQRQTLIHLHCDSTAGHMGINRTIARARPRFYWPGITSDIDLFVKCCEQCQRRRQPVPRPRAPMATSRPSFPLERVGMDIMGPLSITPRGNRYILVIGDYFTKWFEAYALPNIQADTVARYFVDGFVCRYGTPHSLHTDQGPQFESALFQHVCRLLDINKTRTTPYHPQSDGLVERFNRTLEKILAAVVQDHADWDLYLQRALFAYRTSVNDTTAFTPFRLMYGREAALPVDIAYGAPPSTPPTQAPQYVQHLQESLQDSFQKARSAGATPQQRQKRTYDKPASSRQYEVGQLVFLHSPVIPAGKSPKLHNPWTGPHILRTILDNNCVRIESVATKRRQVVHVNRIKPFVQQLASQPTPTYTPTFQPGPPIQPQAVAPPAAPPPAQPHPYNLRNRQNIQRPLIYRGLPS